jgi:hypothetical protein
MIAVLKAKEKPPKLRKAARSENLKKHSKYLNLLPIKRKLINLKKLKNFPMIQFDKMLDNKKINRYFPNINPG